MLFADDGVIGECFLQFFTYQQLDIAIRLRHEILMTFLVDHQSILFSEILFCKLTRSLTDINQRLGFVIHIPSPFPLPGRDD